MKKLLFSMAILTAFASCQKTENQYTTKSGEIAFSTLNDRVTKAANDNNDNYFVYAITSNASTTDRAWFIEEEVYGTNGTDTEGNLYYANQIISGNKHYYPADQDNSVSFYAYSPSVSSNLDMTVDDDFTSVDIVYSAVSGDEDFTVATPITGKTSGTVELIFSHMLAKVSIQVKLSSQLASAGYYFDINDKNDATSVDKDATATLGVNYMTGSIDITDSAPTLISTTAETEAKKYASLTSYMIMPQTAKDCTVQLNGVTVYAPDGSPTSFTDSDLAVYTILGTETGLTNGFVSGKHYIITLTIGNSSTTTDPDNTLVGAEIEFSSDITADWVTDGSVGI